MSEPTQRASRSRYSSPFAAPHNGTPNSSKVAADSAARPKTMLDKWIEPQLAPPRPSFAEAGIERHGVVANMAPLGTRPSARVLKASTKSEFMDSARGATTRRSAASSASTPSEAITTPEPAVNIVRRRSLSAKAENAESTPQTPQQQTPQLPPASARKSVPRPSTAAQHQGQGVFALQQSPLPTNAPRPFIPSFLPPPTQFGPNGEYKIDLDITDRVVESAVQEALDNRRWPTAYALRTLYDDHRMNPRMVRLIDTIYNGRADEQQRKEFQGVMRHKKKEGKKDRTGEYYFNGDGSDPPPRPTQFQPVNYQTPFSTPPARSATGARSLSEAQGRRPSVNLSSVSASTSPQKDAEHLSKRHKSNNFQPAQTLEVNGNASADGKVKAEQPPAPQENGISDSVGRARSGSSTSSSALSSIDEQMLSTDYGTSAVSQAAAGEPGSGAASAHTQSRSANAETHPGVRNPPQPISVPHKPGPKTYTFSTVSTSPSSASAALPSPTNNIINTRQSSSHRRQPSASKGDAMAPAVLLPSSASGQQLPKGKKESNKVTSRPSEDSEQTERTLRMKRKARENTNKIASVPESFERNQVLPPEVESVSDGGDVVALPPRRTNIRLLNKKTRQSQAANYDSDTLSSPTLLSFQPDLAPGSVSVSRAGTPSALSRPSRKAKTGTGLRVKTSPMKKKGGTLAGIPRASGERNSPTSNGAFSHNQEDNDDYCSSCGGNGDLVCCDGCTRSFHFKCVDPPMDENALPDEWFCNVCLTSRLPRRLDEETGPFGSLLALLQRKNPSAFHLPKDIREYFVDVKTGPDGEYEEGVPPKPKNRGGYDEAPDYFRLKDSKGKPIICHQCHAAASAPDRAIIPCTYCGLYWHLDCLDTPLAKEPGPGRPFRCPAHIDDLLATIPAALAPAHRFRKIKGASPIKPAVRRGIKNNGHIEIENDATDDEEELGFYEQREYGHVYKLPEMGIKLDFITQVRRKTGGRGGFAPAGISHVKPAPATVGWDQRTLLEQQAALNLASLTIPNPELGDPKILIDALLAEAPPAVLALIAQGDATNIAQDKVSSMKDRNSLLALRAFIDIKLAAISDEAPTEPAKTEAAVEERTTEVDGSVKAQDAGGEDVEMSG